MPANESPADGGALPKNASPFFGGIGRCDPRHQRGEALENSYALLEFDTATVGRERVTIQIKRADGSVRRRSADGDYEREPLILKLANPRRR